jgi:hypothetical protein
MSTDRPRATALVAALACVSTLLLAAPAYPRSETALGQSAAGMSSPALQWTSLWVPNASFSGRSSHWLVEGKRLRTRITSRGHADRHALVLRTASSQEITVQPTSSVVGATSSGVQYLLSVWVRGRTTRVPARIGLFETAGGTDLGSAVKATTLRDQHWHRLQVTYTAKADGSALTLKITRGGHSPRLRLVVDDLTVRSAAALSDGSPQDRPAWLSGVSGDGVVDGSFGAWRGRPVEIAGTWNDNFESQEWQWSVRPGFSMAQWRGDLDDAVGGIYKDRGESWAAAGDGAYDQRWRRALTNLASSWQGRPGTVYIRFAHEFNGDWYPWAVKSGEVADFKRAWGRFRALQREVFPAAKLVFCPNAETSRSLGYDWRRAFPGRDLVDVVAVDYYNQWPFVSSRAEFAPAMDRFDAWGAPRGLERHREFAESVGLPFAISEWSSNADFGDSPAFMEGLHSWLSEHAGTGAGQVLYEIEFNVGSHGGGNFALHPVNHQPAAVAAYRNLWRGPEKE